MHRIAAFVLSCSILPCVSQAADGDDPGLSVAPPTSSAPSEPNRTPGLIDRLKAIGINPSVVYDGASSSNLAGGIARKTTYLDNLHLQLGVDADKLVGVPGLRFYVDGLRIHGGHPSQLVGDAQGTSNIEGPSIWTLEEAWVQQSLFGNHFSVLIGRYDLNSEFYSLQSSSLFLNSSFGIGPEFSQSGIRGPSIFPYTSLGARFAYKPNPKIVLRAAVLDGAPVNAGTSSFAASSGLLYVGEASYLWKPQPTEQPRRTRLLIGRRTAQSPYASKVAIGVWHYTTRLDDLSETKPDGAPVSRRGSTGVYAVADHQIYQDANDASRQASAFVQLGSGDGRVNRFSRYVGAGLAFAGLIPRRNDDEFGFAVASARNGSHYLALQRQVGQPISARETTIEMFYLARVASWLALQPDFQYVIRPNTDLRVRNTWVGTLRFEVAF